MSKEWLMMNKTIPIKQFARDCVSLYATYSDLDGFYSLDVLDLPDFVQNDFASKFMDYDPSLASEATGPDNTLYESKMLPALLRHLQNSTDKDDAIEFNHIWRDCVTSYFHKMIQAELDDVLAIDNYESRCNPTSLYNRSAHA